MDVWSRVDALVDRAETVSDLHRHRLHLYAAWRWRSLGREIPGELLVLERTAARLRLATQVVVRRVREAYDGPIVLLKGADVATHYPRPELRPSWDIDVLVPDAESVHRALLDHGFEEFKESRLRSPAEHHHLQGLAWPGSPGAIEIHSAPNWPTWLRPPPAEELILAATTESALGNRVLALPSAHHALVLVAHLWRDDPMGRLGPLLDAFLMARDAAPDTVEELARRWELEELWRTTQAAAARVLLGDANATFGVRILTRSLESMRERTVIEARLFEVIAPFFGRDPSRAVAAAARNILSRLQPASNETWPAKLSRTAREFRQSFSPVSAATDRGRTNEQP